MPTHNHSSALDLKPDEAGTKFWHPFKWKPSHTYICHLHAVLNLSAAEIALQVGLSKARVHQILTDPRGIQEIRTAVDRVCENLADLTDQFRAYSPEALAELVREMREGKKGDEVKQRAALSILDRGGYTPIQKHLSISTTIEKDVADRLEAAMREFETIEADYSIISDDEFTIAQDLETEDPTSLDFTEEEYHRRVSSLREEALAPAKGEETQGAADPEQAMTPPE